VLAQLAIGVSYIPPPLNQVSQSVQFNIEKGSKSLHENHKCAHLQSWSYILDMVSLEVTKIIYICVYNIVLKDKA